MILLQNELFMYNKHRRLFIAATIYIEKMKFLRHFSHSDQTTDIIRTGKKKNIYWIYLYVKV